MGTEQLEHKTDHLSPFSAKIKNHEAVTPLPHMLSWYI
jgi:hypothetical protein